MTLAYLDCFSGISSDDHENIAHIYDATWFKMIKAADKCKI